MAGRGAAHDPGGRVRLRLPGGVEGDADFSNCGRYRRKLMRDWTPAGEAPRTVMFVGMNPSVADEEVSDPTCHRERDFAVRWEFTRYLKGNVLDWRATSPADLPSNPRIACSPENVRAVAEMAAESHWVVLAYGKLHPRFRPAVAEVLRAVADSGRPLYCLGRNKDGSPKHPLYLRKDTQPVRFALPEGVRPRRG